MIQGMAGEDVDMAVAQANDCNLRLSRHAMIAAWGGKPQT
jgi:AhpD family alkylhydroperoxidase